MKRILTVLMLAAALLGGCGRKGELLIEPVSLYYPRAEFDPGDGESIIDYELIEGAGLEDCGALLRKYFCTPANEALANPFPEGTELLSAVLRGEEFRIRLTQQAAALTPAEYALGCTCLSMTCFDLTDCREVTVISGTRRLTVRRDSWLLLDDYIPKEESL